MEPASLTMRTRYILLGILVLVLGSCTASHKMVMPTGCKPNRVKPSYRMIEPTYSDHYIRPSNSGMNLLVVEVKKRRR